MSRQINFFLSDSEQDELASVLDSLGSIGAVMPPLSTSYINARSVSEFARWHSGERDPLVFRRSDAERIVTDERSFGYSIDIVMNPVIEFSRCIITNDEVIRGRFYAVTGYIDDAGRKHNKSKEFAGLINTVFKAVKQLSNVTRNGNYIGQGALELESLGYRLRPP